MSTVDRVLVEVVVAAPADVVWKALQDPVELRRWFGWDYAGLDEEIAFIVNNARPEAGGRVIRYENYKDRFELEARGAQTIVRVIRSEAAGTSWEGIYDPETEGWITFIQQLRLYLERHRGADRQTLYLAGHATSDTSPLPITALGLDAVRDLSVGERYSLTTPFGEALSGEVWYRTDGHLGVTVDGYGDGLLFVNHQPPRPTSPHGGAHLLITTYGLDRSSFDRLRERWAGWWNARYERSTVAAGA